MNIEAFHTFAIEQKLVTEDQPFEETGIALRVYGKIFAYIDLQRPHLVVMKCDEERAAFLRAHYRGVAPAWHWNKRYWNEVSLSADVPDDLIRDLALHAISEVLRKLPKKLQRAYADA